MDEQLEEQIEALRVEDAGRVAGESLWPGLAARIERERSPLLRLAGAVAVAASLMIGVWLGARLGESSYAASSDQDLWATLGSTLTQQAAPVVFEESIR